MVQIKGSLKNQVVWSRGKAGSFRRPSRLRFFFLTVTGAVERFFGSVAEKLR